MSHGTIRDQLRKRWPTRGVEAACARKEPLSEDAADLYVGKHKPNDPTLNAYKCWNCSFWHIGHDKRGESAS